MARVRFAEIVAVAAVTAVTGSLAACGSSTAKPSAAPVTVTSTVQAPPASSATTAPAAPASTAGTTASSTPAAQPSTSQPADKSSSTASSGGGVANAGDYVTIDGTLQYLAPGKFLVHPADGSTDQGFYVSDATRILGAAAICGGPDGQVTIGSDDYGTTKCNEDQLETEAKTNAVKVRVTMNRKTGDVQTVAEKYHP